MSYQVLARKWRPQVFEDVVGQGHITRTLQNAITSGRLAHAFLFSGPRGVGKTTTARILAKALNCAEGPTPTPCGRCDSCLETASGTSVDVIEIDGASNRGIEHIRELREAVKYAPVGGKNKVYVIDEVHMLTNEAFNALLKTLEEPPPHVIFIFATTEPQKIPATIHSRCQRYGFKRVALRDIIGRLLVIAAAEGITITDRGLAMIARAAEGSMRDSQSLLDQAVSYSGMEIKDEDLQSILGAIAQERLLQFSAGLLARDAADLLKSIDALLEQGQDLRQFLSGVVEHLRNLMVVKIAADPVHIIELPEADIESIRRQAAGADAEHLILLFDSLSKTLDEMRWSPHQRFTLEIGLIKACSLAKLEPLADVLGRMKEFEARFASDNLARAATATNRISERTASYKPAAKPALLSSQPLTVPDSGDQGELWGRIVSAIKSKKPSLAPFLDHSRLLESSPAALVVGVKGVFQAEQVKKPENCGIIEQIAGEVLGRKVQVEVRAVEATAKPAAKPKVPRKAQPDEHEALAQDVAKLFDGEVIDSDGPEA